MPSQSQQGTFWLNKMSSVLHSKAPERIAGHICWHHTVLALKNRNVTMKKQKMGWMQKKKRKEKNSATVLFGRIDGGYNSFRLFNFQQEGNREINLLSQKSDFNQKWDYYFFFRRLPDINSSRPRIISVNVILQSLLL